MGRSARCVSASTLPGLVLAAALLTACFGGGDNDSSEEDDADATLFVPATLALRPIDATVPDETLPGEENSSVNEALADDNVTAEELAAAYEAYVACLVAGGGSGRYSYDIELQTGLTLEWAEDNSSAGFDRNVLSASCSRRHLGDLTNGFDRANPPPDDLDARRSASIAACIEPISPTAAANLPAEVTVGTTGETTTIGELQLDPAALDPATLGSSPEDTAAVSACIASIGAEWRAFG
jgi:hypothetical protein